MSTKKDTNNKKNQKSAKTKESTTSKAKNKSAQEDKPLTEREKLFCELYIKYNNQGQAYKEAGYKVSNDNSAYTQSSLLLKRKPKIREYITELMKPTHDKNIADAQEILEFLTQVKRGEEKDQFGLDIPIGERTKAALELLKRHDRAEGVADSKLEVSIDWKR